MEPIEPITNIIANGAKPWIPNDEWLTKTLNFLTSLSINIRNFLELHILLITDL